MFPRLGRFFSGLSRFVPGDGEAVPGHLPPEGRRRCRHFCLDFLGLPRVAELVGGDWNMNGL